MAANKDKEKDLETTEETLKAVLRRLKRVRVKRLLKERGRKRAIKNKFPKKNGRLRFQRKLTN